MDRIVNIVVGIVFLMQAFMVFGIGIPPTLLGVAFFIAGLVVMAYPWLPRN
jgi:hypothetical protein